MQKKLYLILIIFLLQFIAGGIFAQDLPTSGDDMIISTTDISEITNNSAKAYWQSTSFAGYGEYRYSKIENDLTSLPWKTDGVVNGNDTGNIYGSYVNLNDLDSDSNYYIELRKGRYYGASPGLFYGPSIVINFKTLKSENIKLYVLNNNIYYDCPDGAMLAPDDLNIDIESVEIINDRFFKDKNYVYQAMADSISRTCSINKYEEIDAKTFEFLTNYYQKDKNNIYYTDNFKGWMNPRVLEDADVVTFTTLNERYAKDKNNAYYIFLNNQVKMTGVDINTLEILKEDDAYALDKDNMYLHGKILSEQGEEIKNDSLYNRLKGKIILTVEANGEAYYVHPGKKEMHFLSRPVVAFYVMREQGVGITNKDLEKIPIADNCPDYMPNCDIPSSYNLNFANQHKGKIFLQVEENGEAWYINPDNSKRYFLGRPTDAFNIMRNLGLGISTVDFDSL